MLHQIDRIQIACFEADSTFKPWAELLEATPDNEDEVEAWTAKRTTFRLGTGFIDFLEPNGPGKVRDALEAKGRPHLFAAGATSKDLSALRAQLRDQVAPTREQHGQLFVDLTESHGTNFRLIVSPHEERPSTGMIDYMYEVTLLVEDAQSVCDTLAQVFGLNSDHFSPIRSETFGYDGKLTLFHPDALHRFEVISPFDREKTMGRYFDRYGESFYMCFSETSQMLEIEHRAKTAGLGITVERPTERPTSIMAEQQWLHPATLNGVMMGLSRPTKAWSWSGRPDRVNDL